MRSTDASNALAETVARFQAEAERLAFAAVRAVIEQELARRGAGSEPSRPRKGTPKKRSQRQLTLALAVTPQRQLELSFGNAVGVAPRADSRAESGDDREQLGELGAALASRPTTAEPPSSVVTGRRARGHWTRENIVSELAAWLLGGTEIDAAFMTRHGPKGLVAAARRVFGRFDAALNVAALHNAKLYPEGPPTRAANGGGLARSPTAASTAIVSGAVGENVS